MPFFELLEVRVHPTRAEMGRAAAERVREIILRRSREQGGARVVFACAPSQDEFLASLCACEIPWAAVTVFHMDEYVGLAADHPASFRAYLDQHLISRIPTPRAVHLIRGDAPAAEECERYARLLAEAPLDLICMGIGENGHLAFNDPPVADFSDPATVKVVALDSICRQQQVNDGCFPTLAEVPREAITLTLPVLLGAREISCVVPGNRKAPAVRDTLMSPVSTACPSSGLRRHAGACMHVDLEAAALVPGLAEPGRRS